MNNYPTQGILALCAVAGLSGLAQAQGPFPGVHLSAGWPHSTADSHSVEPLHFKDSLELDFLIHSGNSAYIAWRPGRASYYLELDDTVQAALVFNDEDADAALLVTSQGLVAKAYDPTQQGLVATHMLLASAWAGVERLWIRHYNGMFRIFGYEGQSNMLHMCDWSGTLGTTATALPSVALPEPMHDMCILDYDKTTPEPELVGLFNSAVVVASFDASSILTSFPASASDALAVGHLPNGAGEALVWATHVIETERLITRFDMHTGGPIITLADEDFGEMLVFDYDMDGAEDVVLASAEGKQIRVYFDDGLGLFNLSEMYEPISYGAEGTVVAMAAGDYDKDADPDLFLLRQSEISTADFYINCSYDQELSRARYISETPPVWTPSGASSTLDLVLNQAPAAETSTYLVQHFVQHGLNGVFFTTPEDSQVVTFSGSEPAILNS